MNPTLALSLTVFGALLLAAVLLDEVAGRARIPGTLLVLILGLLIHNPIEPGADPSLQPLLSLRHAEQITQVALVLVLFFGGLTTNWHQIRPTLTASLRLATVGSLLSAALLTMAMTGVLQLWPIGMGGAVVPLALFVGGMLCSTDATAVLALLRPLRERLPRRVIDLIETESALNDPVAVVLCGLALAMAGGGQAKPDVLVAAVVRQFLLGTTIGFLGGSLTVQLLLSRRSMSASSLLAVVSLSLLMLLAGGTELLGGSSLLAAYIAGLVIGNSVGIDRDALVEAHAGFTKMAELMLFLCMGLVVAPVAVVRDLAPAISVALLLLVTRWLVVHSLLLNTPFERPERHFIALAGLRGAVPIAVAIQAAASRVAWGDRMPALALTVVLCGLLGQGFILTPAARRLGLTGADEPGLAGADGGADGR